MLRNLMPLKNPVKPKMRHFFSLLVVCAVHILRSTKILSRVTTTKARSHVAWRFLVVCGPFNLCTQVCFNCCAETCFRGRGLGKPERLYCCGTETWSQVKWCTARRFPSHQPAWLSLDTWLWSRPFHQVGLFSYGDVRKHGQTRDLLALTSSLISAVSFRSLFLFFSRLYDAQCTCSHAHWFSSKSKSFLSFRSKLLRCWPYLCAFFY